MPGGRFLVLVNPISGRGKGARVARSLPESFGRLGAEADVVLLPGPNSAQKILAEKKTDPYTALVAVGGDGTVSEIAGAAFLTGCKTPIGLIPLGLSNCLARHLSLPLDPEAAAGVIVHGRTVPVDLAMIGGRAALSFIGAGFDAAVVNEVARDRKGAIRDLDYIKKTVSVFFGRNWPSLKVEIDGRLVEGRYFQVIVTSIRNYAHYFRARETGGFSAYLFRGKGRGGLVRALIRAGPSRELGRASDLALPVRSRMRITAAQGDGFVQFDGEAGGPLPADLAVYPGALTFCSP